MPESSVPEQTVPEPSRPEFELQRRPLDDPAARALIEALNAELRAAYPEEGTSHFRLDADEVAEGRGAFLVVTEGERAVACGAVRRISADAAELKRMYVVPERRGRGISRLLLARLEQIARELGADRVVLETGVRQGPAKALYESAGYTQRDARGEVELALLSVFYEKRLAPESA